MNRPVHVFGYDNERKRKFLYAGVCLGFSTDYEELNHGVGQFPCAIIEDIKGCVEPVYVNMIEFIDGLANTILTSNINKEN